MLGPTPKKMPSTTSNTSNNDSNTPKSSNGDGLMVKAINEIFQTVAASESPEQFKVQNIIEFMCLMVC